MNPKFYQVGGCVRDELLRIKPKDYDYVVVGATPEWMLEKGFKQVGADFPVFLHPVTGEEYALARKERKTGTGYHGFTTEHDTSVTLEDDLFRRDLTINAMAKDLQGNLIDPYGGQEDLQLGILRHVSNHFVEDPVRVLRVARFAARYSWTVDRKTKKLMKRLARSGELNHLTPERVWAETSKAIMEPEPAIYFDVLDDCGALEVVLPQLKDRLPRVALTRAWLNKLTEVEKFAILTAMLTEAECKEFYETLKAPNEIAKPAIKFNAVLPNLTTVWRKQALETLTKLDAYRDKDIVTTVSNAFYAYTETHCNLPFVYNKVKDISFKDLTPEQQANLKGPEIAQAIHNLRLEQLSYG